GGAPTSILTVSPGGRLAFDNTNNVNLARLSTNIPLNVDGGRFELVGNTTGDTIQTAIGAGLNAVGDASFTITNPGAMTTSLSSINRSNRGTMLFRGTSLGSAATGVSQVLLDAPLNTPVGEAGGTGSKIGILPFATGDASGTASGPTGF